MGGGTAVTQPPTPAQEAISNAMIAALISCATLSLGIITYLDLTTMPAYLNLTMTSLLVTGYIVPNITAFWLGHPIHNIMVASQNRSIFVTVLSERITVTFTEPRR